MAVGAISKATTSKPRCASSSASSPSPHPTTRANLPLLVLARSSGVSSLLFEHYSRGGEDAGGAMSTPFLGEGVTSPQHTLPRITAHGVSLLPGTGSDLFSFCC